jgi:hypothetical protein
MVGLLASVQAATVLLSVSWLAGSAICSAAEPRSTALGRDTLLELLRSCSLEKPSGRVLVGQLAAVVNGEDNSARFAKRLGDAPAIYHWEAFWNYEADGCAHYIHRSIEEARRGSVVAIGWVNKEPPKVGTTLVDCDLTNPTRDVEACAIFWGEWVEKLAGYLVALDEQNIPVLLRPLHEPENRSWIAAGKKSFKNVWRQLYGELVHQRKLNNVIFVLGLDHTTDTDYLPEAPYVNIVGTSEYVDPPYREKDFHHLQWLRALEDYKGKPVAICETSSIKNKGARARAVDYLNALQKYAPFVCYLSWWHESTDNDYQWALYQAEQAAMFVADPRVMTQSSLRKALVR